MIRVVFVIYTIIVYIILFVENKYRRKEFLTLWNQSHDFGTYHLDTDVESFARSGCNYQPLESNEHGYHRFKKLVVNISKDKQYRFLKHAHAPLKAR